MKSIFYIAYKYLFFKNKSQAINVLSLITMIAMGCGTGALIIILSTFNGFEEISKSLCESFQADLTITPTKNKQFDLNDVDLRELKSDKNILAASKVLEEKVYIKYREADALATIKGVDNEFFKTNEIEQFIVAGDSILETEDHSFALVGAGIASKMNMNFENNLESISVYYPKSEFSGGLNENFELNYIIPGGAFSIFQEYDDKYLITPLSFVQYLNNADASRISALELKIIPGSEDQVRDHISKLLGDSFKVKNKLELNETFYRISRIEKMIVFLIMIFILVILSFNFIGSLTMHMIEKSKDIQTLHFIGLSKNKIFSLYLTIGIFQGLLGGLIGLVVGMVICGIQKVFGIVQMPGSGSFVISSYPVSIHFSDILWIIFILILVSLTASIFPAAKARQSLTN